MRGSGNEVEYKLIFSLTNNRASLCTDFATILEMMKMQICMILGRNMKVWKYVWNWEEIWIYENVNVYELGKKCVQIYDEPPPRPFHTFKFPHIAVEVETTPQVSHHHNLHHHHHVIIIIVITVITIISSHHFCDAFARWTFAVNIQVQFSLIWFFQFVALKNEDPQNQLCIKFKTLMTPSKIGRMQVPRNNLYSKSKI